MNQFALKIFLFVWNHARIIGKNDALLGNPRNEILSCQSECNREYVSCFEFCPCNEKCPSGCKDCDNSICKGVLVLNTFRLKLINLYMICHISGFIKIVYLTVLYHSANQPLK